MSFQTLLTNPALRAALSKIAIEGERGPDAYLRASIEHGWSRNVLTHHISTRLQEREGKALTNFS
jgi:predicted nuclease of restriction endonuclease-like (RecB) superfamily